MTCKKCGREIPENSAVCPICGETFSEDAVEETVKIPDSSVQEPEENTDLEFTGEEINDTQFEETEYSEETNESEIDESVPVKKFGFGKIAAAAAVVIIAALALFSGYNEIFGKSEEFAPFIYLKETKSGNNVCVNDYNGNEFTLIKDFESGNSFSRNSNFVTGGKNLFYLDDGTLKLYIAGKDKSEVISKNVLSASTVISANDKTILFVKKLNDENTLCSYTAGKKVKEITKLEKIKYATGSTPCYGFLKGTDKPWYVKIKDDTKAGELFADGKSIAKKVSGVEYISGDAKNIVYKTQSGENTKLNIIENGKKSVILSENDAADKPVYYVETPAKGIIYMSDIDANAKSDSSFSSGTLYYKEFGKKPKAIDTEVSIYAMVKEMSGYGVSSFDDGLSDNGNDILIYMQKNEILMSNGGTNLTLPEGFSYSTASPAFSDDGSRIIYTDSNEALVYCDLKNGKWDAPVTIAKNNAVCAAVNSSADMIAYVVTDGDGNSSKNALRLYSTEKKETYKVTDNTASSPYFGKDSKTLYYTDKLNEEQGSAAINCTNGKKSDIVDKEINGFASGSANDPIVFKLADESGQKLDIYTIKNGKLLEIAKNIINVFYY